MTLNSKCVWIYPEIHKKIKKLAVEKESTIMKEVNEILKEKIDGDNDIDNVE